MFANNFIFTKERSKFGHHFQNGIVNDFPRVDSDGKIHVRTFRIVEQLKVKHVGQE